MSAEINILLPIGSVVLLKEAEKRLMVYGIKQIDTSTNTEFDYVGVLYPEGNIGDDTKFLFNHEDIETVFFIGYEDVERQVFINQLSMLQELENDEQKE